jgi:protein TonB
MANEKEFKVVETMPIFPSCKAIKNDKKRRRCTEEKLIRFVYKNLEYPTIARENDIQGLVVVSFVVDEIGKIIDINCIKDIGGGCGGEVVRVIELMNEKNIVWIPGTQRGKAVTVKYNLPVRFRLNPENLNTSSSKKWWQFWK